MEIYLQRSVLDIYTDSSTTDSEDSAYPRHRVLPISLTSSQSDIMERDVMCAAEDKKQVYVDSKGQLKLAIYVNYGLLTIHIMQGKNFVSDYSPVCNSYCKVQIMPDEQNRTRVKTDFVADTNSPLFDEKVSFELLDNDLDKRILISVFHKISPQEGSEFLGSMSFGIKHIESSEKTINGWYKLLTEELGCKKHLLAKTKQRKGVLQESNDGNVPKVNQDILWMDTHILVIRKGKHGYGFSLTGVSPVQVCRVEPVSIAFQSGLRQGDCIVRINGLNVSRSASDSVARIVRSSDKQVVLEVQRAQSLVSSDRGVQNAPSTSTLTDDEEKKRSPMKRFSSFRLPKFTKESINTLKKFGTLPRNKKKIETITEKS